MSDEQPTCCGEGGSATKAGGPLVAACALCPRSPTYWRRDGKPLLTAAESYGSVATETTGAPVRRGQPLAFDVEGRVVPARSDEPA